ncbi:MAG: glycosyltransferase family 2 protein [Flavobacteriaceae bacterium]
MKKIAVVILNWNGVKLLDQFLPSVLAFSNEAQIYLADNASTDASVQFVKDNYPTVKIIQNEGNFGYAHGYNVALQHVDEPYFCLLNSDVEVTENWLTPILSIFEKENHVAIIQPKILDFKNKQYFEYAGAAGGYIDKYGYPYCRGRIFDSIEKDNGQYDDFCEIFWASGACLFIRKEVFEKLGGFDESFFAHQEEIDLCWRSKNTGYKTYYTSQSVIYHVGGATLKESNPKKTFLNFRNSLLMLVKNLPEKKILPIIFTRLVLDGLAGVQFILKGKFSHCWAIIKAHFHFYSLINKFLKKRTNNQTEKYFKTKSIVFNYFVKGGKVFEEN